MAAEPMRALSVQQPWAWAVLHGKSVENRSWPTAYRGLVAIHASKKPDDDAFALIAARDRDSPLAKAVAWHSRLWTPPRFVYGAVVAVAEITGCHPKYHICNPEGPETVCSPWAVWGQCHWLLADARALPEPIPCRGSLGLWKLPEDVERAVHEQLEASRG